jgi:hypothetical protein
VNITPWAIAAISHGHELPGTGKRVINDNRVLNVSPIKRSSELPIAIPILALLRAFGAKAAIRCGTPTTKQSNGIRPRELPASAKAKGIVSSEMIVAILRNAMVIIPLL